MVKTKRCIKEYIIPNNHNIQSYENNNENIRYDIEKRNYLELRSTNGIAVFIKLINFIIKTFVSVSTPNADSSLANSIPVPTYTPSIDATQSTIPPIVTPTVAPMYSLFTVPFDASQSDHDKLAHAHIISSTLSPSISVTVAITVILPIADACLLSLTANISSRLACCSTPKNPPWNVPTLVTTNVQNLFVNILQSAVTTQSPTKPPTVLPNVGCMYNALDQTDYDAIFLMKNFGGYNGSSLSFDFETQNLVGHSWKDIAPNGLSNKHTLNCIFYILNLTITKCYANVT